MSGEVALSALPGVRYGTTARHGDGRGSFRELWRDAETPAAMSPAPKAPPANTTAQSGPPETKVV